jgi:hypothetical protein
LPLPPLRSARAHTPKAATPIRRGLVLHTARAFEPRCERSADEAHLLAPPVGLANGSSSARGTPGAVASVRARLQRWTQREGTSDEALYREVGERR